MEVNMKKIYSLIFVSACALTGFAQGSSETGIIINGITWATRNVDMPGTFAAAPESAGMFYMWNNNVGWSVSNPLTATDGNNTWRSLYGTGDVWTSNNDPSPAGWRVPTLDELKSLLNTQYVTNSWATRNGINGRLFTDISSGNSIFLRAVGHRIDRDGTLSSSDTQGYYWSSTITSQCSTCPGELVFSNSTNGIMTSYDFSYYIQSIRSVSSNASAVENIQSDNLQIYVYNDKLFIKGELQTDNVQIFDICGIQMLNDKLPNTQAIDISALSNGIYLVKNGNKTAKFVKS
jgi:hypothetical protein